MMRLLGSVLVLGATLWFGAYFAAKEKYRLQELQSWNVQSCFCKARLPTFPLL